MIGAASAKFTNTLRSIAPATKPVKMSQKSSIADVESMLDYLLATVMLAKKGDHDPKSAYAYARTVLRDAEVALRKGGFHDMAHHAVDESERLVLARQFDEADQLILNTAREMMERSGTNDRLRKLYAPPHSTRKQ
jgi:hypothetical protein